MQEKPPLQFRLVKEEAVVMPIKEERPLLVVKPKEELARPLIQELLDDSWTTVERKKRKSK
jgi:hypothetical protein